MNSNIGTSKIKKIFKEIQEKYKVWEVIEIWRSWIEVMRNLFRL